jgi:hypothetical protein
MSIRIKHAKDYCPYFSLSMKKLREITCPNKVSPDSRQGRHSGIFFFKKYGRFANGGKKECPGGTAEVP